MYIRNLALLLMVFRVAQALIALKEENTRRCSDGLGWQCQRKEPVRR